MSGNIPCPHWVYIIAEPGQDESELAHQGRLNWYAYILMDVGHLYPSLSISQIQSFPGISQKVVDATLWHLAY